MEVKIESIKVNNRRRDVGNIDELKKSIGQIGLLQPITVTSDYTLIAGYHRLTACRQLGWDSIPVNVVHLEALHAELAEIDENLVRNELTMFERSQWQHRRKEIYETMYPETKNGGDRKSEEVKSERKDCVLIEEKTEAYSENAAKIQGRSKRTIELESRRGKILAPIADLIKGTRFEDNGKELDDLVKIADPKKGEGYDIARQVLVIADENQRLRIKQARLQLKKRMEIEEAEQEPVQAPAIIENKAPVFKVEPGQVWKLEEHTLVCNNSYEIVKNVTADALISDPPYGIDYRPDWHKWDGTAGQFRRVLGDDQDFDPRMFLNFPTVLLFGANYFSDKLPIGGWLCWDKRVREELDSMMGSPFELAWYRSQHTSRRSIIVRVQHGGVVNADSISGNNDKRFHPTQKPIEVMRTILNQLTRPGETVFDPFCGSGSTLIACQETNRKCIGVELEPEYCKVTLNRFFEKYKIEACLV